MSNKRFSEVMKIGRKLVGKDQPALVIADIGANFDGSFEKAKKLAWAVKEAGGDVVKIQSFLAPKIVSGRGFSSMKLQGIQGRGGKPVSEFFKAAEFPESGTRNFSITAEK